MNTAVAHPTAARPSAATPRKNDGAKPSDSSPEAASIRALERLAVLESVLAHQLRDKDETLLGGLRFMLSDLCDDVDAMTPKLAEPNATPEATPNDGDLYRDLKGKASEIRGFTGDVRHELDKIMYALDEGFGFLSGGEGGRGKAPAREYRRYLQGIARGSFVELLRCLQTAEAIADDMADDISRKAKSRAA